MKIFPYHFTKNIKNLLRVLCVLCVFCIAYAVFRFIRIALSTDVSLDFYTVLQNLVSAIVGVVGLVVSLSMLKNTQYELTDTHFIVRFGLIVSRYSLDEITGVHLFTESKKLVVYFKNNTFLVVVVKEEWYREFVDELLKRNKRISYEEGTNYEKDE